MTLFYPQPIAALQEAVGVAPIKRDIWGNFSVEEDTVNYSPGPRHARLLKSYGYYKPLL